MVLVCRRAGGPFSPALAALPSQIGHSAKKIKGKHPLGRQTVPGPCESPTAALSDPPDTPPQSVVVTGDNSSIFNAITALQGNRSPRSEAIPLLSGRDTSTRQACQAARQPTGRPVSPDGLASAPERACDPPSGSQTRPSGSRCPSPLLPRHLSARPKRSRCGRPAFPRRPGHESSGRAH